MQANGIFRQSQATIFDPSQTLTVNDNCAFRMKTHCQCRKEAEDMWVRIGNTDEVAFDAIVAASEQALDLWSKSQACQTCPTHVYERLPLLYDKLIELLDGAVTTYTSPPPPRTPVLSDVHSTPLMSERQTCRRPSSQQHSSHSNGQESIMSGISMSQSTPSIVCRPAEMLFGEYVLTEEQSRHLALELIARKLKSLATIFRQVLDQPDDINETKARVDAALSRALRLLSTVHRRLALVQASSVRKTDDMVLESVDTDDPKPYQTFWRQVEKG